MILLTRIGLEKCVQTNYDNWRRDEEKRAACKQRGIKLIELNFDEWDGTEDGVKRAIAGDFKIYRPKAEVIKENGKIISYRVYVD